MKSVFSIVFYFLPLIAHAGLSFEQLNKLSASPDYLQGHFVQEKYLMDIEATLTSSGLFSYQREVEIKWETLQPIENMLVMTPTSIINRQGSQELITLQADSNPIVVMISDIFFSVLTANWNQLERYFSLTGSMDGSEWHAVLTPTDESVMQIVNSVELTGNQFVKKLIFFEKNGDHTTLYFDKLTQ